MKCPTCNTPMTQLFTSWVCDSCQPAADSADLQLSETEKSLWFSPDTPLSGKVVTLKASSGVGPVDRHIPVEHLPFLRIIPLNTPSHFPSGMTVIYPHVVILQYYTSVVGPTGHVLKQRYTTFLGFIAIPPYPRKAEHLTEAEELALFPNGYSQFIQPSPRN